MGGEEVGGEEVGGEVVMIEDTKKSNERRKMNQKR